MDRSTTQAGTQRPVGLGRWGRIGFGLTSSLFLVLLVAAMILLSQANLEYGRLAVERQAAQAASVLQAWFREQGSEEDDENRPDPQVELPEVMANVMGLALYDVRSRSLVAWGSVLPSPAALQGMGQRSSPQPFGDRVIWQDDGRVLYVKLMPAQGRSSRMGMGDQPGRRLAAEPGAGGMLVIEYDGSPLLQSSNLRQTLLVILGLAALMLLAGLVWLFFRIQRLQAHLEQQQALAKLGTAARTLAHEVRNPLSIIIMQKSLLQRQLGEEHQAALTVIGDEAGRIEHQVKMVRQVLGQENPDFAPAAAENPGGAVIPQLIDLSAALPALVASLPAWQGRVSLPQADALAGSTTSCPVRIGEPALRSIIVNLVDNALEASRQETAPLAQVHLAWRRLGKRVLIEVDDQSGGIPREHRKRIFDPFFTTKPNGSGVGLSLARQLVEEASGRLEYRHLPPRGSSFRVRLPWGGL